jgi:hypothetical protein
MSSDFSTRVTGSWVAGNVTGGSGNVVDSHVGTDAGVPGLDEILRALTDLRTTIESNAAEIEKAPYALRDIDDIQTEVGEDTPDAHRIRDAFNRLIERVGQASELLGGVYYAKHLIEAFLQ